MFIVLRSKSGFVHRVNFSNVSAYYDNGDGVTVVFNDSDSSDYQGTSKSIDKMLMQIGVIIYSPAKTVKTTDDNISKAKVRKALAAYMVSECMDMAYDLHIRNAKALAELLDMDLYEDESGVDYDKYL